MYKVRTEHTHQEHKLTLSSQDVSRAGAASLSHCFSANHQWLKISSDDAKWHLCLQVFLLMPASSLGSWRASATGSSGSPPQVFQEPGTPEEDQRCSRPGV